LTIIYRFLTILCQLEKIKISVVGNSVAIRIRPREENGQVYSLILKDLMSNSGIKEVIVSNLSVSRLITEEVIDDKDHFLNNDQEITIINLGCVDAPTRDIPLWFSDIIFNRRGKLLQAIFNPIYQYVIPKFRSKLVRMRGYNSWVSLDRFNINMDEIISSLVGKSKIVVLGINPGNERIEKQLPKTLTRYRLYNEVLQSVCNNHGITFISTLDLKSEEYFPDGVHYNRVGHQLIAGRIFDSLI
jgi:lysophospholipase L1-like esterase